jgi:hypothetical protein
MEELDLPSRDRMMYLASWDVALHAANSLVTTWIFLFWDYCQFVIKLEGEREI